MPAFKITLLGLLYCFIAFALGSKCPQDAISKLVVCYYNGETSLANLNVCNCTHLVFTTGVRKAENNSISASEDTTKLLEVIKERKENLSVLFTFETKQEETSTILKSENRSEELINGILEFLQESKFDGVELNFKFATNDGVPKESYASFVKSLSKTLSSQHRRVKREGYDVFEKVTDDITTASYTTQTPKNSTSKTQSIKEKKPKENNRKVREDKKDGVDVEDADDDDDDTNADYATLEEAINAKFAEEKSQNQITLEDVDNVSEEKKFSVFVRLSIKPEIVAKKYDLKVLSRYADILTVPTHNIVNSNEDHLTYHPSRLMGLSDIQNTDSILDFLTGMGAPKTKMVITLPATVLKFQLKDESKNTPRSPARSKPQVVDQSQLCSLFNKNNWTIERDDDLTAPYAFSGKTWLAFEDEISVNIKGKYILLRDLAGGAIYPIDADVNDGLCTNRTGTGGYLSGALHKNFESLERKPRALVLQSLQDEIHDTAYTNIEAGVRLSEYRIVRVVDHSGAVHVIRKNTKTQFECSRQGYFSHPLGCNKFYRCVKFDQYSDEFTVFEYDCPAGLAFDERWEVCVWPGSLPHGAPCTGSSEIAPVPRSHYQCPNHEGEDKGYYADPENCRWFFACLDHARDGITPLTAYEFRCPFGLVFSEEKLACDWPWLVGTCGNKGAAGYLQVNAAGQSQGFHSATFINGGNLEASLGQFGNTDEEAAFIGFGKKFGSGLKGTSVYTGQGAYQGAQSAGFGYIANQYDDHHDRASFAAFPEYKISGGRILNKGGLVLDQNVAGIAGVDTGGIGGLSGVATGSVTSTSGVGTGGVAGVYGVGSAGAVGSSGHVTGDVAGISGVGSGGVVGISGVVPATVTNAGVGTGGVAGVYGVGSAGAAEISGHATGGVPGISGIGSGDVTRISGGVPAGAVGISGLSTGGVSGISEVGSAGVVGISPVTTASVTTGAVDGLLGVNIRHGASKSLHSGVGQEIRQFGSGIHTSSINIQKLEPALQTNTLEISGINGGGQASFQNPVSTPKPFVVSIPSVQVNGEKVSGHSTIVHTTPQSLVFKQTPQPENIKVQVTGKAIADSHGFSVSQPAFSVGLPAVTPTPATHTFGEVISGGSGASYFSTPSVSFASSPKPEVHRFGQNQFTNRISANQAAVTVGVPVVTGTESYKYTSGFSSGQSVPVAVPVVTPKPAVGTVAYTAGVSISQSSPTENPFVGFTQVNNRNSGGKALEKSFVEIPARIPVVQTHININEGQNLVSGNAAQAGISYGAPVLTATPSVYASNGKFGSESHLSTVLSGPTPTPFVHSTIDEKVSNEIRFNNPSYVVTPKTEFHTFSKTTSDKYSGLNVNAVSNKIPLATVKPDYQVFSQSGVTGNTGAAVTYGVPAVTPQPNLNSFKLYGGQASGVGVTPVVGFDSTVTANEFGQTAGVAKGFSQAVPKSNVHAFQQTSSFQQKGVSQAEISSYGVPVVPVVKTGAVTPTFITPRPEVKFSQSAAPISTGFGQRYSYGSTFKQTGSQFETIQPFGAVSSTPAPAVIQKTNLFVPKIEQSNVLTDVSIEQQPIVSLGTVSTVSAGKTFSTPSTQSSVFSQSPVVSSFSFKSDYVQPQHVSVTTPAPVVSLTPSTPIELSQPSFSVFGKSSQSIVHSQGEKIGLETSGPVLQQTVVSSPGSIIFNQKSSNQQEIKSFTPVITTAASPSYSQGISTGFGSKSSFYSQSNAYLPPVTPKTEIFGSTLQQSVVPFGTTERSQVLIEKEPVSQNFGFFKTKSFEEKRTEFRQPQVTVTTAVPAYQPIVTTTSKPFTPREELVELEIAKSIEINPADIPRSASPSPGPIVIQQQPVHLISEKTFQIKPGLQPLYKQQDKDLRVQINTIPQEQYVFRQQVNIKTPVVPQQKEYIPPVVTVKPVVSISTAKPINIQQPAVESVTPVVPAFEPTRVPLVTQKESIISNINENSSPAGIIKVQGFVGQFESRQPQEAVPSKINLLPTVTELPHFTPEELSLQTHQSFDSQKISTFGSTPVQNVFIQPEISSTLKPSVNAFETSGHLFQYNRAQNFSSGQTAFGTGIKYAINPNIAIPEPPREYILAQNAYTTVAPEVVTTGQFQSTESIRSGISGSTYLPPQVGSRRKPSKATIISVGNLDKGEVQDDNIQQIFDKYSGRFGQVINGRNDRVVTKVINGEGRGKIEVDRQGSSTVQYEVSSTTPRPKSRGRQYHGAITSGLQATNKYEEYDIDGNRDGQRSFDAGRGGEDKSDSSKATIDLKNLKLEKDKKTVIVVSQVSDANPVLIGKLAGQCSCQSNMLELRGKAKKTKGSSRRKTKFSQNEQQQATIINEYLPPFEADSEVQIASKVETSTAAPETVVIGGRKAVNTRIAYTSEQNYVSSSTTAQPDVVSSTILSSLGPEGVLSITPKTLFEDKISRKKQFRGKTRFLPPIISDDGTSVLSPVPASEIASTFDYNVLKGDESRTQNEIDGGRFGGSRKALAGAAFDRYGPGGWRSFDETLQGSIDCQRPGLFRHPKYCNKFYACNYDPWEERYTLHVFNCPIQLTYDSSISACNWPVRGPACADDNLLV